MPLIDVHSSIEALSIIPKTGLGMPLFVVSDATVEEDYYNEYRTVASMNNDSELPSSVKNNAILKAKLAYVFAQANRHEKFAVLGTANVANALLAFKDKDYFFILSGDEVVATKTAIANHVDSNDNKRLRIAIFQHDTVAKGLPFNSKKRVVSFYNPVATEHFDAAAVANIGSFDPGTLTWKFKTVTGITTQYLSETEMLAIDDARMIAYAYKHGKAQLSEGWTSYITDEDEIPKYIDDLHGEAWVRYDVERKIARALQDNDKLPYDSRGIKLLEGCATTTLLAAAGMGIIGVDDDGQYVYKVWSIPRDQQELTDVAMRKYKGIYYSYRKSGAIHEVWAYGSVEF